MQTPPKALIDGRAKEHRICTFIGSSQDGKSQPRRDWPTDCLGGVSNSVLE